MKKKKRFVKDFDNLILHEIILVAPQEYQLVL